MFKILIQQKPDGMTTVERRTSQEFILLKASPSTGKVIAINSLFPNNFHHGSCRFAMMR